MTKDEALKLSMEAMEITGGFDVEILAIKEALAQPEQPKVRTGNCLRVGVCASEGHKIQPQRKPLTDEQIMANDVLRYHFALNGGAGPISKQGRKIIDAIEAAHGIKGEA